MNNVQRSRIECFHREHLRRLGGLVPKRGADRGCQTRCDREHLIPIACDCLTALDHVAGDGLDRPDGQQISVRLPIQ